MAANIARPMGSTGFTVPTSLLNRSVIVLLQLLALAIITLPATPQNAAATAQSYSALRTPHSALTTRGASGDLWADVIIGKPDFGSISPYTTVPNKGFWDFGTIVDRSSSTDNKFYLYDAGNNRILGFRLDGPSGCLNRPGNPVLNCSADIVIGQPNMSSSGCNGDSGFQNWPNLSIPSNATLCTQQESEPSPAEGASGASMAINAQGDLYVVDHWGHRVLKFPAPFSQSGLVSATDVWGQPDYTSRSCNGPSHTPGPTTLCFGTGGSNNWTAGVEVEPTPGGYNVWVADSQNNRVLRFPSGSHTADIVIGQPNFASTTPGNGANQINAPAALRISPTTGKLYVADQGNNRVMVYAPPFSTNMNGTVFGPNPNPDPSNCPGINVQRFCRPSGLEFDPDQANRPGVWINNTYHFTWERWNESNSGGSPSEVIGVPDDGNRLGGGTGSMGITSAGKRFISAGSGSYMNNVLVFDPAFSNSSPSRLVFGEAPGGNAITAAGLSGGRGVAVSDNQLIVADAGRILYWNNPTSATGALLLTNGQAADGVLAPNASGVITTGRRMTGCCTLLKADANHHLWVGSNDSVDHIYAYTLPLNSNSQPIASFTFPFNVLGGGSISGVSGTEFTGLAPSPNSDFLWVSHADTNRTFRIRNPLSGSRQVDIILGQTSVSGTQCNRGGAPRTGALPNSLCNPGSLSFDRLGNLFISDHSLESRGNMRLLEFNSSLFPLTNTQVILGLSASKIYPDIATWEPAFDSQNRMVIGYNFYWSLNPGPPGGISRFPGVYYDPLTPAPAATPSAFLQDYYSMGFAATFDKYDNLYVGDLNRSKVLLYNHPLQVLAGHVTWQGRPAQPNTGQQVPITLTLKSAAAEVNYPSATTDASGFFTAPINGLALGAYSWRVKNPKFLANSGNTTLAGDGITNVDMGQMRTGDANNDNIVNVSDFSILKNTFGKGGCPTPDPGYDDRADFNGDCVVNVTDEALLSSNYGHAGAPPINPR